MRAIILPAAFKASSALLVKSPAHVPNPISVIFIVCLFTSEVIKEAEDKTVCYCVDGAVCEDEACKIILEKHADCDVIEGVSKSAHAASYFHRLPL